MEQLKKKYFLNNAFSFITKILFILLLFSSFYSCENSTDVQDHKNFIDPTKYLPTLQFDGQDLGDSGEYGHHNMYAHCLLGRPGTTKLYPQTLSKYLDHFN